MTHSDADSHSHGAGHGGLSQTDSAEAWDARYSGHDLVWGAEPNRFVAEHTAELPAGTAIDLACGEGRNAIYLARKGWKVTGVDYSKVAIDRARTLEESIAWVWADITSYWPDPVDLAMIVYAHLPAAARRTVLRNTAAALKPGGRLLVVGHNTRNIAEGTGGPQDPSILYTPTDILDDLGKVAPDLLTEVAAEPLREVPGAGRPAIDTVILVRRP